MKLKGKKVTNGIKIKSEGLNKEEKKIILDDVRNAIRKIQYKRKKENRQSLSYWINLK